MLNLRDVVSALNRYPKYLGVSVFASEIMGKFPDFFQIDDKYYCAKRWGRALLVQPQVVFLSPYSVKLSYIPDMYPKFGEHGQTHKGVLIGQPILNGTGRHILTVQWINEHPLLLKRQTVGWYPYSGGLVQYIKEELCPKL